MGLFCTWTHGESSGHVWFIHQKRFSSLLFCRISLTLCFCFGFSRQRCHSLSVLASQAIVHFHTSGLVLEAKCGKESWRKYWDLSYILCITGPLFSIQGDGCFPRACSSLRYCGSAMGLALEQGRGFMINKTRNYPFSIELTGCFFPDILSRKRD